MLPLGSGVNHNVQELSCLSGLFPAWVSAFPNSNGGPNELNAGYHLKAVRNLSYFNQRDSCTFSEWTASLLWCLQWPQRKSQTC
jgi:hypothetical protein